MKKHRNIRLWIIAAFIALLATLLFAAKLDFLLVTGESNRPVWALPLYGQRNFSLAYTHSVQKTPVVENFKVNPGPMLLLQSTVYQSLGVGLPFLPEEGKLTIVEDKFVLSGIDRQFKELNLISLPLAEQALIYKGKRYKFSHSFSPGEQISIKIKTMSPGRAVLTILLS